MVVVYALGFSAIFFGVETLFARILRGILGDARYDALTDSPSSAATVGLNYHSLRFWNAAVLGAYTLVAILVFPQQQKLFAVLGGIGIGVFTGHFFIGALIALGLGWGLQIIMR